MRLLKRLDAHIDVLKDHITKGIITRVTIYKNRAQAGDCYVDIGLVDTWVAIENEVKDGNMLETTCSINRGTNVHKFDKAKKVFSELENDLNRTIKWDPSSKVPFNDFINKIKDKINSLQ